ncbi:MAG: polysaccharide deacetylase [Tenericutes bacterium HGW-Tenericutes-4]|jgi:peptidoglycan/xylan/chitin deacetylase (PgdA/CDA1 family)|nr:MAG: polysaccharide deacetylase [Tenericutes bacterium HGW-Tenericutes-4]
MKREKFFVHGVANVVIMLVILFMMIMTNTLYPIAFTSGEGYNAIYRGNSNNKNISLMINVYWGTEFIEPMLEVLEINNAKATFFVGGTWANSNPDILQKIYDAGHEIANHGYYHKDHTRITKERNSEEIYITHELIKALINYEMTLFAPPSGAFNDVTLEVANSLGYKTIMWSKDTIDWRDKDSSLILKRATKTPQNGDLILMHPTEHTLQALQDIITYYIDNNYALVSVSENIAN